MTVPEAKRARATGLAALAGPIGESLADGEEPRWRRDGHVAMTAAHSVTASVADQVELLREWKREARQMLGRDPAYVPLVELLAEREVLTGREVEAFLRGLKTMKYSLTTYKGHILVEVDQRKYLLDTGSPCSVGSRPVQLNGREFAMQASDPMGHTCESIAAMVGTAFDGLIGMDILGEFDLEISLAEGTIDLWDEQIDMSAGSQIESLQGVPLVECVVNGGLARMLFDTGAPLSYLSEGFVQGCATLGEEEDFHPLYGPFRVPTFSVPVRAWGHQMTIRAGQMPVSMESALRLVGADGILGTEALQHGTLRLSLRQKHAELMAN